MGKKLTKTVVLGVLVILIVVMISADGDSEGLSFSEKKAKLLARKDDKGKYKYYEDAGGRSNRAIGSYSSNDGNLLKDPAPSMPSTTMSAPYDSFTHAMNMMNSTKPRTRIKGRLIKNITIAPGICHSIDIRNYVEGLEVLRPCRVIEGFLQIVLMENINPNITIRPFDQLREITGYLMLYRVSTIKNIGQLFPNLEVIRGDSLFLDYSFMVYEMANLQKLGLARLTKIPRGTIRIEKNPSLCYAETIDWRRIVMAGEIIIGENVNSPSQCPGCPGCPDGHCWSAKECQGTEKLNCHPQCLANCTGPTDRDCYVCKNYNHEGRCMEKCPEGLYGYLSRRCVTQDECWNMHDMRPTSDEDNKKMTPFNGFCSTHCPDGYEDAIDSKNRTTCIECKGRCQKSTVGAVIRHISDVEQLRGVSVIKGSLEFQMRNGNPSIMDELTTAFGLVEEITGYLKVTHSFPITNLGFFKKLRIIGGEKTDINNASLVILDNPNLSKLFPEDQDIKILRGRLFFHYNPRLCLSEIMRLGERVGITDLTEMEVEPESNGDKVACDFVNINIKVREKGSTYANLEWTVYKPSEGQTLLRYLLNYAETNDENIPYDTNACGNNVWRVNDVQTVAGSVSPVVGTKISDLKPYTKYAVYVKTMSARDKTQVGGTTGQSRIIFFTTEPDTPSVPTDVISFPVSESEIVVNWNPPEAPNGPIGYYKVSGFLRPENQELLQARNFCDFPPEVWVIDEAPEVTIKTPALNPPKSCCQKDPERKTSSRKFQIFCYDNMTISASPIDGRNYCNAYRCDVEHPPFEGDLTSPMSSIKEAPPLDLTQDVLDNKMTRMYNDTYYSFVFDVPSNSTSYLLKKLRHFSLYTISVAACGKKPSKNTEMCSPIEYTSTSTKKKEVADNVRKVGVQVSNDTIVMLTWEPPLDPNGLTVAYTVEWMNLMIKDAKSTSECIPALYFRGMKVISNLSPGRYSARVRSISLAGEGLWSKEVTFAVGMENSNIPSIAMGITFVCIVGILIIAFFLVRSHQKRKQQERLIASVNPDYIESKYVRDSWEVPRENVEVLEELGLGNFGMVYRGIMNGLTAVAIKTIPETCSEKDKNEFLNEASVMKNFSTFHIIKLLGVVSDGVPPYVIMELMENGDLKTYLRRIRDTSQAPDTSRVIRMACEIADGMAYLESKKFIHRDLAARNCMVSKDIVCKIGDFGMARDIYETDYYKIGQKGLLPIRWMAPENLSDGVFTSDSDVWSFGVVLYEILTLGELPYQGFSNDEVLHHVLRKGTVNIPRNCPEIILKLMEKCFKWRPSERPTFMEIVAELEPFVGQDFCEKSFYHSEEGIEVRNAGLKKVYHHAAQIRFHWGNETARWVREFEDNVTLLDQTKAGTSRGRIFKNGFQHFGNIPIMEDVPLDR